MDVFIPEEYVTRRRDERKAAAGARKRSEEMESSRRKPQKPHFQQIGNEHTSSTQTLVFSENIVYGCCFSA
ncbi:hypothetical protein RHMOL_Rhmol07G0109800 [Rhododendron molle]|uniref:Uncharacterized protein n=1 Tax=Rhododendron molle TaxID=49168 RepID=A0ACC0N0E7_RHOML|nr:hypothetical protein RHMOL_Rhmol07G0109800 [Rhododendron molle]